MIFDGCFERWSYSPNSVSTLRGSYGSCTGRCLIRVLTLGLSIFPVNFRIAGLVWNVALHFDCAGSHKVCAPVFWAQSGPEHFSSKIRIKFPKQSVRDRVPRHCIEILLQRSCQEVSYINLAKRAFKESWYKDLIKRSCQEISYRDLVQEVLPRDLLQIFVQRSCMRSLTEISPTELL